MLNSAATTSKTLKERLKDRHLIVVANREPYQIYRYQDELKLERTTGGLVSALDPILQNCKGLWICWDGAVERESNFEDLCRLAELNKIQLPYQVKTIPLSEEEITRYYYGFSNRQLWPLFHYLSSHYHFDEQDWSHYAQVNRKFAEVAVKNASPNSLIWIQDYHLMLVPNDIRKINPQANVGFFSHIPFPHYEVFRMLPTRRQILEGMLGSDIIGFHTPSYAYYFMECAEKLLPDKVKILDSKTLAYDSRKILVGDFPIGIDFEKIDTYARLPVVDEAVKHIRNHFQSPVEFIGIGVDRLDYSKGILERLECMALFFERYPAYKGRLVFIQIAVPSRVYVREYQQIKQEIDEAVGRINGRYSQEGWTPIHYLYRGFPLEELIAYYKAADFALVNSLRDGMNLVAKEYCAAQTESNGALILSEMTGASGQLENGFLVNPYDHPAVVEAIHTVLNMPHPEKRMQMQALRQGIQDHNIGKWVTNFMDEFHDAIANRHSPISKPIAAYAGL
jgi:trehalose 6-phosphate synthase/phosphatase